MPISLADSFENDQKRHYPALKAANAYIINDSVHADFLTANSQPTAIYNAIPTNILENGAIRNRQLPGYPPEIEDDANQIEIKRYIYMKLS